MLPTKYLSQTKTIESKVKLFSKERHGARASWHFLCAIKTEDTATLPSALIK
jgi:hypothetical protein